MYFCVCMSVCTHTYITWTRAKYNPNQLVLGHALSALHILEHTKKMHNLLSHEYNGAFHQTHGGQRCFYKISRDFCIKQKLKLWKIIKKDKKKASPWFLMKFRAVMVEINFDVMSAILILIFLFFCLHVWISVCAIDRIEFMHVLHGECMF